MADELISRDAIARLWRKNAELILKLPVVLEGLYNDAVSEDPKVRLPARKELLEYTRGFMEQYQYHLEQGTVEKMLEQYDPRTLATLKLLLDKLKESGGIIDVDAFIKGSKNGEGDHES